VAVTSPVGENAADDSWISCRCPIGLLGGVGLSRDGLSPLLPGWKAHRTAARRSLLCGLEPACSCRAFCRLIGLIAISRHCGKPQPASGSDQFPAQLSAGMAAGGDDLQKNS